MQYGKDKGFRQPTLERWLRLKEPDQQALLGLAQELKIGENHFRDFLDWLEEISLRDRATIRAILRLESITQIFSDPRLGRSDKVKRIKEEVRRLRFPRLSRIEEEVQNRIREMKLRSEIRITVPPGLEGGTLTVQLKASRYEDLKAWVKELSEALKKKEMKEIFIFLGEGENAGL